MYLDDILILAQSPSTLREHMKILAHELQSLGFVLNEKKCIWDPKRIIEFLGFLIDSVSMSIYLPVDKVQKVKKECRHILNRAHQSGRQLAQIIGLLSSIIPAVEIAPLHYRSLQRCRNIAVTSGNYDHLVKLSREAKNDLRWWLQHINQNNGRPVKPLILR